MKTYAQAIERAGNWYWKVKDFPEFVSGGYSDMLYGMTDSIAFIYGTSLLEVRQDIKRFAAEIEAEKYCG